MVRVSIVTPVMNEMQRIDNYLDQFRMQLVPPFELIFVDASKDSALVDYLECAKKEMPYIHVYKQSGGATGTANAMNQGVDAATGDVVLILGVDAILASDFVKTISDGFEMLKASDAVSFELDPIDIPLHSWVETAYYYRDKSRWLANPTFWHYRREVFPRFPAGLGYGEDKVWLSECEKVRLRHVTGDSNLKLSHFITGPVTVRDIYRRYSWYGRTGMRYYRASGDKAHLVKMFLAVLSIPFLPLCIIPAARGFFYASRVWREYPDGLVTIPLVEALAFPFMAIGFWQSLFKKSVARDA